jgi:4'-phosphopantetheinyl transferase
MTNFSALPTRPLTGSDIHIWCASLNVSREDLSHYLSLLSQDEVTRVDRFYFETDRDHFVVGRGILRTLLGGYLGLKPAQIEFVYSSHGKPAVKSELKDKVLEFNLSHSKDRALYVFNWNRPVGIDIEYMIPMADMDNFAEQFFTARESAWINSLSGYPKEEAFFKTWTCKEAFLKANGNGLTTPINQVDISLEGADPVTLKSTSEDQGSVGNWSFKTFIPIPGYQAALAVEGYGGQIIFRQLDG